MGKLVTGTVGWAGKNKFGKYSLKLEENEQWFSSKEDIPCAKGDTVEFDSGSTGKYCDKLRVVTSGGGTPYSSGGGASAPTKPGTLSQKDRCIVRQNALTNARSAFGDGGVLPTEAGFSDAVIELAKEFEAYTSGDFEIVPVGTGTVGGDDDDFLQ